MKNDSKAVLNLIAQTIYDKKGFNTLALDVRGISTLTDYVIIAEGSVDRHVSSIAHWCRSPGLQRGWAPKRTKPSFADRLTIGTA